MKQPNVLYVMCDQLRFDAMAAAGNSMVRTPNLDRLSRRGVRFTNAYSSCPVCVPARYIIRTGCEPYHTLAYNNAGASGDGTEQAGMEERCGKYLARTMADLGYRTFGIGKFHTIPWNEDLGYETHLYSEEIFEDVTQRAEDDYVSFITSEHPAYAHIEQLHGERTEMYYVPQMSPLPADLTVEAWVTDQAVEHIARDDGRPYFGFVSFIGPHPPMAPPIPYNRMYNPDNMDNPVCGVPETDHLDEQIPWMNHLIWADDISPAMARMIKARYYGEITYIDHCIGRLLDAVESRPDADNTLICFFSDHGDHLGDHDAWQKESFFDASCRIPYLLSWPKKLEGNGCCEELVGLVDLFGIATTAAGSGELRDGINVLGMLEGKSSPREYLFGYYRAGNDAPLKVMVRDREWKYIYMGNGGREQLFHLNDDPCELHQQIDERPDIAERMRTVAAEQLERVGLIDALEGDQLRKFPYTERAYSRIHQFDVSVENNDYLL